MRLFHPGMLMRRLVRSTGSLQAWLGSLLLVVAMIATAAPPFPVLTGRVVDVAQLLSPQAVARLNQVLEAQEQATGNQVVVVTLESLQGYDIADYGYQLGRHWRIGQAGKDNGVLFIIAPKERKTRIEVGYGLEGALTDALSKQIIDNEVIPYFKTGDFGGGIESGATAILAALGGSYDSSVKQSEPRKTEPDFARLFIVVIVFMFVGGLVNEFKGAKAAIGSVLVGASLVGGFLANSLFIGLIVGLFALFLYFVSQSSGGGRGSGGGYYGGGGGGYSGGGGFSGGGGSFGGGGASGSW